MKSDKDKHHMTLLICGLKYDTNEPICKAETDSQTQRAGPWLPRTRAGEVKDWEFGISRRKLLYIGWIKNKVLLYSTGNYIQYPVANHNGKEYRNRKEKKKPAVASR